MVDARALEVEMLELCGLNYKSTYFPFISKWKPFVKVDLQGHRARDEADLRNRINVAQQGLS